MKNRFAVLLLIGICLSVPGNAQDQIASMDNEPHYSRVFSNGYCRAYAVSLNRLEETQPVVHEHDWVRMTVSGAVEQAWAGLCIRAKATRIPKAM